MELTQKGEMVSRLQAKAGQIGKILNNLEKYNHLIKDDKKPADRNREKRSSLIKEFTIKTPTEPYKTDLELLAKLGSPAEPKEPKVPAENPTETESVACSLP